MRLGRVRSQFSRAGAAASSGKPRGGVPGQNVDPRGASRRRRQCPRQAPLRPCPAWVTKPPWPLLGDVRVGGSCGRGGGSATTAAAASTAAAFAGGRADVRGGWAPGAKRLGSCGPLFAADAGDGVSKEEAAGRGAAPAAPRLLGGDPGWSRGLSVVRAGGTGRVWIGRHVPLEEGLDLCGMGQRRLGPLTLNFAGGGGEAVGGVTGTTSGKGSSKEGIHLLTATQN